MPCTLSANSLGLVEWKSAFSYEMMPLEYQDISDWSKLCIPYWVVPSLMRSGMLSDLVNVADVVLHGRRVDEHLAGRHATGAVGAGDEAQRHHRLEGGGQREAHVGLLVRRVERTARGDGLGGVGGVQRAEHHVPRVGGLQRDLQRLEGRGSRR